MLHRWNERLRNHPVTVRAALALFTFAIYRGALQNLFVYDDESQILANPFVLNPHLWTKIFTGSVWSFQSAASRDGYYRPLYIFSYWIVCRIVGPSPPLFHVVQILIYAATAWLVYRLGCEIFKHESAALAGAGLWVLHPLHVEAAAWFGGMADVGWGFFSLLAFLLFVRAEKAESPGARAHLVPALAYFPALFFKELALMFPLLLIAYWIFLSPASSASAAREWAGRMLRWTPYVAAVAAYFAIRVNVVASFGRTKSLWKVSGRNVLSALALLGEHARIFTWPLGLNPGRAFNMEACLRSPWPWAALLLVGLCLLFREQNRPLAFLMAWWVITLLPCLDIRQLSVPKVADRYSYLPSVGPCLALAFVALDWLPARAGGHRLARISAPALAVLATFWGALTVIDIPHWRTDDAIMMNVQANAPDAAWPVPHVVRGDVLRFQQGDLDGAEREYQTALRLNQIPGEKSDQVTYDCYMGLGAVAQDRKRDERALEFFQKAADLMPQLSPAYDAMGAYYFPRYDFAAASRYFSSAVHANPWDVVAHVYLGNCWMKLGRFRDAAEEFHAARYVDPTLKQAYLSEARALEALGDAPAAAKTRESYHQ